MFELQFATYLLNWRVIKPAPVHSNIKLNLVKIITVWRVNLFNALSIIQTK